MGWTTPTVLTTNTAITAAVWNAQITDNMAYLGNTHNHDGDPGDGSLYALLPQGIILIADAACPTGWTRVAAFDGLFVRGAASYGATGGADTHTHSHTHTGAHSHVQNSGAQDQSVAGATTGAVAATAEGSSMYQSTGSAGSIPSLWGGTVSSGPTSGNDASSGSTLPAYISVIFCKKN